MDHVVQRDAGGAHHNKRAFHNQANCTVERLHRQLKDTLHVRGAAVAWVDHLPWVILGLRVALKDESGESAKEAPLGRSLVFPGQPNAPEGSLPAALRAPPVVIPPTRWSYTEVVASPYPLDSAEWVYVQRGASGDAPCRQVRGAPYLCCPTGQRSSSSRWGRGRTAPAEISSSLKRRIHFGRPAWTWVPYRGGSL